jgi:hypothetical protein
MNSGAEPCIIEQRSVKKMRDGTNSLFISSTRPSVSVRGTAVLFNRSTSTRIPEMTLAAEHAEVKIHLAPLNHLAHLVRNHGKRDLLAVRLAARKRFGKVQSLLRLDLGGKWRVERIDNCLHDCRAWSAEECVQGMTALTRIFHRKANAAAGMGEPREIDRVQVNAVLGIAEKNHLFPFNLPERGRCERRKLRTSTLLA